MNALAKEIVKATEGLNKAIAYQEKLEDDYATVKALNGQRGYSVSVNGVNVDVARMDQQTYMAAMIRGREMIHLGALKALSAMIGDAKESVAGHKKYLAWLAHRMASEAGQDGAA